MLEHQIEINRLAAEFESCRQLLQALGDENRQHLILEMMRMGECGGVRIGAIPEGCRSFEDAQRRYEKLLLF